MSVEGRKYYLYAIRLDDAVLQKKPFRDANPAYRPGKACYYVGSSIYAPAERFRKHKQGERSSKWVREFGLHVAKKKCRVMQELVPGERQVEEARFAEALRAKGYGIWQK